MGVVLTAFYLMAGLAAGAWLTQQIERRVYGTRYEAGPARPVNFTTVPSTPRADRWMYAAGPVSALFGVAAALVVIPFSRTWIGADLGIGVFYFIVVVDFTVLGLAMGGWGANTPDGAEVYYRATAQLISYVIPLGLAYIGAIMMAKSLSTVKIVEAQSGLWFIVTQPVGFALYVVTALMQSFRPPFVEAFSRKIDYGVLTLYGGGYAVIWRVAMSGLLFAVSAMGAVLFLGGWQGPLLPGPVWMLLKTLLMMLLLTVAGSQIQPLTTHQMLQFSWKVLTPVGLANVLLVGLEILLGVGVK